MKRIFFRIFLLFCLAALTIYLFDFTFLKLSEKENSSLETPPMPDSENLQEVKPPVIEQGPAPFSYDEYLSTFDISSDTDGFEVTDKVFDDSMEIFLVSLSNRSYIPEDVRYEIEGTPYYTLWPRMGYIVLADGVQKKILSPDGSMIPIPEQHDLSIAVARDSENRTVFCDWGNNGAYVTLSYDGTVTASDYNPISDNRGILFDYPSYYGLSDNEKCVRVYTNRGFGYTIDGEEARDVITSYKKAFNYSEGFGCAVDAQDRLYFFNEEGRLRIGGLSVIMFYGCGDVLDERSLGYYYFDEGLTRATKKTFSKGKLVSERQIFIDREGDEFKIPADYNIYSYSNGRILLEKDGNYGYLTSRGKWISPPSFTFARPFFEGLAVVGDKDGKKGVIDRDGNYVISPVFDEITDCSGGIICAYSAECGWQIFNKKSPIPVVEQAADIETETTETETDKPEENTEVLA